MDHRDRPNQSLNRSTSFHACLEAHGLYDHVQCVLRLSPLIHKRIASIQSRAIGDLSIEDLLALSTYFHETIHWWQHIGSTSGLMLSLRHPGQAHTNFPRLKRLLAQGAPVKSILRWSEQSAGPSTVDPDSTQGLLNTIVNNYFDIEFFRALITDPHLTRQVVDDKRFESVGHSYKIAYSNILFVLATTIGDDFDVLNDPSRWTDAFDALRKEKQKGYYFGSPVLECPIGVRQLVEGQARFSQLQFLHFGSGGKVEWGTARTHGLLSGHYVDAFNTFLSLTGREWPDSIDHSTIGMFLLVCDIALNPGEGFPMPLKTPITFIDDVTPGFRFVYLSRLLATKCLHLMPSIINYSADEYRRVTEELCSALLIASPLSVATMMSRAASTAPPFIALMGEHQHSHYAPANLPVRFLFAHFLAFCADKAVYPEFFCWPGAWMARSKASPIGERLFSAHEAPFMDKEEDGGIYPRIVPGKDSTKVQDTFDTFYAMNITYDMTRQWVAESGEFRYDYDWLSSSGTAAELRDFADRHFLLIYGVHPRDFRIL